MVESWHSQSMYIHVASNSGYITIADEKDMPLIRKLCHVLFTYIDISSTNECHVSFAEHQVKLWYT